MLRPSLIKITPLKEEGVFDALVRGRLAAVQFTMLEDVAALGNVIESYTLTIEHCEDHELTIPALKRQTRSQGSEKALSQHKIDVGKSLKALTRGLSSVTANLPPLPSMIHSLFHHFERWPNQGSRLAKCGHTHALHQEQS